MQKFLIIQTAFIGDVVLATAVIEKLHKYFPDDQIDFLVRKGNETLLANNPYLHEVLVWDKKNNKTKNLFLLLKKIRKTKYDKIINLQRYFSTGLLTAFSGAKETIGFDKNPLGFLFNKKVKHRFSIAHPVHETERNNDLIKDFTDNIPAKPKLYPSLSDIESIRQYTSQVFITITPSSVWFTKKYPAEKWLDFINNIPDKYKIYLLGGKDNFDEADTLRTSSGNKNIVTLAGKLSYLESTALMQFAKMNYVNDSAPLHFASSVNAPVTAVFCSTIPAFGYSPLSDKSFIAETDVPLDCRPCSIHGRTACPLGHFKCAYTIETQKLLNAITVKHAV